MVELTGPEPPEPVHPARADALDRADRAWRCRVAGGTWRDAAMVAGFSDGHHAARAVRSMFGQLPRPERDDLRDVWRSRLETLWREGLRDVLDRRPGAVTACVRVAQAAAALDGLDAPSRLDVQVSETFDAIVMELVQHDLA